MGVKVEVHVAQTAENHEVGGGDREPESGERPLRRATAHGVKPHWNQDEAEIEGRLGQILQHQGGQAGQVRLLMALLDRELKGAVFLAEEMREKAPPRRGISPGDERLVRGGERQLQVKQQSGGHAADEDA